MILQRRHSWMVLAAAAAMLCGLVAACRGGHNVAAERVARAQRGTGDIVIAVAWPWKEQADVKFGDGLDLAVDQVNAAGGIYGRKIRLLRGDDHESVNDGRVLAQRFSADPDVVAVIGHLQSYVTVPAAAIYDLSGVLMLAPVATDPELTELGYQRVFRATFTDSTVGRRLAEFAASRGYRRIAIEYIRDRYGRGIANAFEERATELGLAIVARDSYDASGHADEHSFDATVTDWKGQPMDAILLAGENPSAALFLVALRKSGITAPVLGGDALSSNDLLRLAGRAAEGTVVATVFHPDEPGPEVERFVNAFEERYGVPPDGGAALGYDAANLLASAMKRAHSTVPNDIARALRETRGWRGVTGTFTFDADGDPIDKPVVMTVVHGGRFVYLPATVVAKASGSGR